MTTTGTYNLTAAPVLDPAPWATVGWGVITAAPEHQVADQALVFLGVRATSALKYKDANACNFMTTLGRGRHLFWDNWLESQSNGYAMSGQDPFIYCGQ